MRPLLPLLGILLLTATVSPASALPPCAAADDGTAVCAYDYASGSQDCAESPSAGWRHTVGFVEAPGQASVMLYGAHTCERWSSDKGDGAYSSDVIVLHASLYGTPAPFFLTAMWFDDGSASEAHLAAHDGQQEVAYEHAPTPVGPPDAGWGHLLP